MHLKDPLLKPHHMYIKPCHVHNPLQKKKPNHVHKQRRKISHGHKYFNQENKERKTSLFFYCSTQTVNLLNQIFCFDVPIEHIRTYTIGNASEEIHKTTFNPKTVLIHCGTNDLVRMNPESLIQETQKLIESTTRKFPDSRIIYSSILPRQDNLHPQVVKVNNTMEQYCELRTIKFLNNNHISQQYQYYDSKHLNNRGFKFFAKNLKSAIYGTNVKRQQSRKGLHQPSHFSPQPSPFPPQPSQFQPHADPKRTRPNTSHCRARGPPSP